MLAKDATKRQLTRSLELGSYWNVFYMLVDSKFCPTSLKIIKYFREPLGVLSASGKGLINNLKLATDLFQSVFFLKMLFLVIFLTEICRNTIQISGK